MKMAGRVRSVLFALLGLGACGAEGGEIVQLHAKSKSEKTEDLRCKQLVFDSVAAVMENQASDFYKTIPDLRSFTQSLGGTSHPTDFLYLKRGGSFYDLRYNYVDWLQRITLDRSAEIVTELEKADLPVVRRSEGDELVVITNSETVLEADAAAAASWALDGAEIEFVYMDYSIKNGYYCIPVCWRRKDGYFSFDIIGKHPELGRKYQLFSINGETLLPFLEDYANGVDHLGYTGWRYNENNFMVGDHEKNQPLTLGLHRGSEYRELTYECSALCCPIESAGKIHAERTPNGCLTFDLSNLRPGVYLLWEKLIVVE